MFISYLDFRHQEGVRATTISLASFSFGLVAKADYQTYPTVC